MLPGGLAGSWSNWLDPIVSGSMRPTWSKNCYGIPNSCRSFDALRETSVYSSTRLFFVQNLSCLGTTWLFHPTPQLLSKQTYYPGWKAPTAGPSESQGACGMCQRKSLSLLYHVLLLGRTPRTSSCLTSTYQLKHLFFVEKLNRFPQKY